MIKALESAFQLYYLLVIRWITLLHVVLLAILGADVGPVSLLASLVLYCLALSLFWHTVSKVLEDAPLLLLVDIIIAAVAIWISGSTWQSPYFLYGFTTLLISTHFFSTPGSFLATGFFAALYTAGIMLNPQVLRQIAVQGDMDSLVSNYLAFALIPLFYGYPVKILKRTKQAQEATIQAEQYLVKSQQLLSQLKTPEPLSSRELEVLRCLSLGKTNAQIAAELHIAETTVKRHLYRIFKKLGINSRMQAVLFFDSELLSQKQSDS